MVRIWAVVLVLALVSVDRPAPAAVSDGTLRLPAAFSGLLQGLAPEPLRFAQSEAAGHVKRRPIHHRKPDNTIAESGIPPRPAPSATDRLFKATSLSAEDLENTRRTRVESPSLSSREERIVNSLRRNALR